MNQKSTPQREIIDPNFIPLQLQTRKTWLTTCLIAVLAFIFGLELLTSQSWVTPSSLALVTMGALSHFLILEHNEWYRILAAAFLHGSYMHLLFNSLALHMVGRPLEMLIGRKWLWGLFILSAIGGGLLSLAINPSSTLSVGASGGIMGLISALFVLSYRFPKGKERKRTQIQLLYMLVPALLPIFTLGQMKIDFAAHFGGAITGAIFAYGFYLSWRTTSAPQWIKWGTPLLVVTSLLTLTTFVWAGFNYAKIQKELRLEAELIPATELQQFMSQPEANLIAQLQQWKTEFPKDPRVPYLLAMIALDHNQLPLAEEQAQEALEVLAASQSQAFQERFEYEIRSTLSLVQLRADKKEEARQTIEPVCSIATTALSDDPRHAEIKSLCEDP